MPNETPIAEVPCMDCGRPYPHGLDVVLTKKQWLMIHPGDGGVLCPSCVVNRAAKLPGAISVYAHIEFGQDHDLAPEILEKLILAIRLENADYCAANGDLKHELAALRARCERYEKPVSDEEWATTKTWPKGLWRDHLDALLADRLKGE